jgi:diacylglycerol O-acyltransferase
MYWNGARLAGLYPVSIPFDGFAINFTVVSNNDNLDFGIVACRHTLPQVQRMIDYLDQALVELEEATGIGSRKPPRKTTPRKKAATGKKPAPKKPRARKPAKGKAPAKRTATRKPETGKAPPRKARPKKSA